MKAMVRMVLQIPMQAATLVIIANPEYGTWHVHEMVWKVRSLFITTDDFSSQQMTGQLPSILTSNIGCAFLFLCVLHVIV